MGIGIYIYIFTYYLPLNINHSCRVHLQSPHQSKEFVHVIKSSSSPEPTSQQLLGVFSNHLPHLKHVDLSRGQE